MKIEVKGAAAKIDQLFRFDKSARRAMQKGIRSASEAVRQDASSRMPGLALDNWGLWNNNGRYVSYDQGAKRISVSVRSREREGFRRIKAKVGFSSGNAAGAIFGLAGSQPGTKSRHPQGPIRSRNFKAAMNRRHGGGYTVRNSQVWPRALTPAYYAKGPQARDEIGRAIEQAVKAANK